MYDAIFLLVVSFMIFCENVYYAREYEHKIRHYLRNFSFSAMNGVVTVLYVLLFGWFLSFASGAFPFGVIKLLTNNSVISFLLAFLIFDMWIYFWHRANHEIKFLWRMHRVHHNDLAMDVSTVFRFHPFEIAISSVLNMFIIILFGLKIEHVILYKLLFNINVAIHHSNIDIPDKVDRLLKKFIVTPNMHRVHHSQYHVETDSNYSSVLSIWDRIFGTYNSSDASDIVFGLKKFADEKYQTVRGLLFLPFV